MGRHIWPQGAPCVSCGTPLDLDEQYQLPSGGGIIWPLCKEDRDAIVAWETEQGSYGYTYEDPKQQSVLWLYVFAVAVAFAAFATYVLASLLR